MTYDGKCYDLARCFLSDEELAEDEKAIDRVAQRDSGRHRIRDRMAAHGSRREGGKVMTDYPFSTTLREGANTSALPRTRIMRGVVYGLLITAAVLAWRFAL